MKMNCEQWAGPGSNCMTCGVEALKHPGHPPTPKARGCKSFADCSPDVGCEPPPPGYCWFCRLPREWHFNASTLIEGLTQAERTKLYAELLKLQVGTVCLDETANTWCMSLSGTVGPRVTMTFAPVAHLAMRLTRLVILEPQYEFVEKSQTVVTRVEKKTVRTFFGGEVVVAPASVTEDRFDYHGLDKVPRGAWRVRSLFVGCDAAFPTTADVSGDLFAPDGPYTLTIETTPGTTISLVVENKTQRELPFCAVLLGTRVEAKKSVGVNWDGDIPLGESVHR